MKRIRLEIGYLLAGAILLLAAGRLQSQIDTSGLQEVPREQLPKVATFYWAAGNLPPLPCPPGDLDVPIYALGSNHFLIDNSSIDSGLSRGSSSMLSASFPHGPGGGDFSDNPDTRRNYEKFAPQSFSVINTNDAAANDTNLYNFLISFPPDTNTYPTLQIKLYRTNAVIIKANHFDYSGETVRDFALLVCDSPARPTWKSVDLAGSSDAQDGWLVQGTVPNYAVTDPMFLMVSNILTTREAVFRAIPFGGPEVVLSGANQFDTVSNIITLHAAITDLSGTATTNQRAVVTVNGLPARYTMGPSNTISLDTRYAPSGFQDIEVNFGSVPLAFDWQNPPIDTKLEYDTMATLYLDFENSAFLVNASDMCSPNIGTNYILFGLSQPDTIEVTITDPSSGRLLATNYAVIPSAGTVAIPWNFTEADGVTTYTNDTYAVHFIAFDPTSLNITNKIDRKGVRMGEGTIITYVEEDPSDITGSLLNSQADIWIHQTLSFLYNDIYDPWGLTQYTRNVGWDYDVGYARNITAFAIDTYVPTTHNNGWRQFLQLKLGSFLYSDATIGPTHGSPTSIGTFSGEIASTRDLLAWTSAAGNTWRMRKVAVWSCQSGANGLVLTNTAYPTFAEAFGIRPKALQDSTFMMKNAGLFWAGGIDQGWFGSGGSPQTLCEAEEAFDQMWVTGPNSFPGGCDPNFAIYKALNRLLGAYSNLQKFNPVLEGYWWLPYSTIHDDEIMGNNLTHVK